MTIITFFLIILSSFYLVTESSAFLDNNLYTQNVSGIKIDNAGDEVSVDDLLKCVSNDSTLYQYLSEENQIKRGVYTTGTTIDFDDYIETGRFFIKDDFDSKKPYAVIGNNILKDVIEENGIKYYGYNGELFEVIGAFEKNNSDLDNVIYLNLTYLLETNGVNGVYFSDSNSAASVEKTISNLYDELGGTLIVYEQEKSDLAIGHKLKFILAIISAICNLFMTAHYFVLKQKYKMAVKKLCGFTNKLICKEYCKIVLMLVCISYIIGVLLAITLSHVTTAFATESVSRGSFILSAILLILTGGLVTIQIIRNAIRVDISSVLKGS